MSLTWTTDLYHVTKTLFGKVAELWKKTPDYGNILNKNKSQKTNIKKRYTDWGEEDWQLSDMQGRGCYDVQNFVCDKMKDGFDRPVHKPPPPTQGPNCLGDGWEGYPGSTYCYYIKTLVNEPVGNNSKGVDFEEAYAFCRYFRLYYVVLFGKFENRFPMTKSSHVTIF